MIDVQPFSAQSNTKPTAKTDDMTWSDSDSDSNSESDSDSANSGAEEDDKTKKTDGKKTDEKTAKNRTMAGLTRLERRRLLLIDRQKIKIQKRLGFDPNSKELSAEAERELAAWIKKRDAMQAKLEERQKIRKAKKEAKRLRVMAKRGMKKKEKARAAQTKAVKRKQKDAKPSTATST